MMVQRQRLFEDVDRHLLEDKQPSAFFNSVDHAGGFMEYPLTMLPLLKKIEQSPVYHPEGNVWNHTMLVVDAAADRKGESSDSRAFMWAALLHDVGKADTTQNRKGKITSYNHEKVGAKLAEEFLSQFCDEKDFIFKVAALVRWHMQLLFVVKDLPFADIKRMKADISIEDAALLGLCDRLGRLDADLEKEKQNVRIFIDKCSANL